MSQTLDGKAQPLSNQVDRAWQLLRGRQYEAAMTVFSEVYRSAPNHLGALRGFAVACLRLRRYARALELLDQALVLDPNDYRSMRLLADAYRYIGKVQEEIQLRRILVANEPTKKDFERLWSLYIDEGKSEDAVAILQDAISAFPDERQNYIRLADLYQRSGRPTELVLETLTTATSRFPQDIAICDRKGRLLFRMGEYARAYDDLRRVAHEKPTPFHLYYLALAAIEVGSYEEALDAIAIAIERHLDEARYYNARGLAFFKLGRFDEAVSCFREAVAHGKRPHAEFLHNLGVALLRQGNIDAASQQFEAAIGIDPHYSEALICLGEICHMKGELEQARQFFQAAVTLPSPGSNDGSEAAHDSARDSEEADHSVALRLSSWPTPAKVEVRQQRHVRDTTLVRDLKELYDFHCQLCGTRLVIGKMTYYCEVHHMQPLGAEHDGPDIRANMVVVCPNHHAALDFGSVCITLGSHKVYEYDGARIIEVGRLTLHPNHQLDDAFLAYHVERIFLGKL